MFYNQRVNASFVYADKFEAVGGIIALGKV